MNEITESVARFLEAQGFVIVSTLDADSFPHSSCKGMLKVEGNRVFLIDCYRGETRKNLLADARMSVTAVDEGNYRGYCLKGRGRVVEGADISAPCLERWRDRKTGRTTSRVIRNIRAQQTTGRHPEAAFPEPKHLIVLEVEEVVDLARFSQKP